MCVIMVKGVTVDRLGPVKRDKKILSLLVHKNVMVIS